MSAAIESGTGRWAEIAETHLMAELARALALRKRSGTSVGTATDPGSLICRIQDHILNYHTIPVRIIGRQLDSCPELNSVM